MVQDVTRRGVISATGAVATLLLLPGCQSLPGLSLTEAVRRLLVLSSDRAFARLLQPGGFYDDALTRIPVPDTLARNGVSPIITAILGSNAFKTALQRELNDAAQEGAERAAPVVAQAIRNVSIADAAALLRGGPEAATTFLKAAMAGALIETMFPDIGNALKIAQDPAVSQALRSATGVDVAALTRFVTDEADDAIWKAIGREEAYIRANPRSINDPLLTAVLGGRF